MRKMLEGGIADPESPANKLTDKRYAAFVAAFDFEEHGETATTYIAGAAPAIDKYLRQTLEENAGNENEGVRLALYFERKAASLTSFYEVLADPALAKVVRTALGLPDSFASADIDSQVKLFEEQVRHRGFLRSGEARQIPDALHQPVGDQQPDCAGAGVAQRAVQPAGRIRHLDRACFSPSSR